MLFQDARDYQILFLSAFLFLGICSRDWTLRLDLIAVAILCCLLTQACLAQVAKFVNSKKQKKEQSYHALSRSYPFWEFLSTSSWKSALITALGLSLLLRANHWTTIAIAGCLAIGSKFVFRWRGKHFFNPANLGIIAALTLTQDAWISPGQWGSDWGYFLLFLGTGGMILNRVSRGETSAVFLLTYGGLELIRDVWLGWSWDVLEHQLIKGSLLVFAFFMITDPRSLPNSTISRVIWAMSVAVLAFILQHQFYINTAIFWSLFLLSPLTLFLDWIWSAPRFTWEKRMVGNVHPTE